MKGFYLGVSPEAGPIAPHALDLEQVSFTLPSAGPATLVYDRLDWPRGPTFEDPERGVRIAASGWFLYKGAYNDLECLGRDLTEALLTGSVDSALEGLQAGAFLLVIAHEDRTTFITDPFGLHPHYSPGGDPWRGIAPVPSSFSTPEDPLRAGILAKQGHLFGEETAFTDIRRLPPGHRIDGNGAKRFFAYRGIPNAVEDVFEVLQIRLRSFPHERTRILPLSGGLDSRLILAAGTFDVGYTLGPPDTGDRPVARRFAGHFRDYDEFSLLDLTYPSALRDAARPLAAGWVRDPFFELLVVYDRIAARWGSGGLFFDGYLGDVLQRFTYLIPTGSRGMLGKLWPSTVLTGLEPLTLLRSRYPRLVGAELDLLESAYHDTVGSLDLDPAHAVLLFEIIAGRGARYTLTGGTVFSSLFFTPIQPFFFYEVFQRLFAARPEDGMRYRSVRTIWNRVPDAFAEIPTYAGFRPRGHPDQSRITLLTNKALAKAGLRRGAASYETELPRIRWRDG